jgi:AraC-like DNA-binding protein
LGAKTTLFSLSVKARAVFLALLLCLGVAAGVCARGQADRESRQRLAEVEQLIDEKRYNEAVALLSQVVKEDPDRFDAAERLMERIRSLRAEIDRSFAELNNAIRENKLEEIVALMDQIEELNPYPSDTEVELLDMLRAAGVEQIYFVNVFRDLMARARLQIEAGEYRPAVSTYLEGFQINKDRFDQEGYGNIVENAVNSALDNLKIAIAACDRLTGELQGEGEGLGEQLENLPSDMAALTATLESMTEALGTVERSGLTFQTQNRRIRESSREDQFDLFLVFADQLVFGPANSTNEGISYALASIWRREAGQLASRLTTRGEAAYSSVVGAFRRGAAEQSLGSAEEARTLFESALRFQTMWPLPVDASRPYPLGSAGQEAFAEALPAYLRTQEYLKALDGYAFLAQADGQVTDLEAKDVTTIGEVYEDRDKLSSLFDRIEALESSWSDLLARYREGETVGIALGDHALQAERVIADIENTKQAVAALDIRLLDRVARVQGVEFEERFRSYNASFQEGVELQEGTEVSLEPIRDESGQVVETPVRVDKYPSRALAIFQPLSEDLEQLAGEASEMLDDALQREYVEQSEELQVHVRSLRSLVARISELQQQLGPRLEDARRASLQAERYRREGELRYQQAVTNVGNRRFDEARSNIQASREAFDTSLSFEEDAEARRIRDEALVALSNSITETLTVGVVREVRERIEVAKRLYAQGDFAGAERRLLEAQDWWEDANSTENPEVAFWLRIVRSAVDATTGREIAITDPLYKEISQLYNLAYRDFETGRQLLQQRQTGEALRVLRRAEDRLAKILVPFPNNAAARVLNLRILQVSDPEVFRSRITELYNDALAIRNRNPQDAYANLKDIEQLQPNYPGLQRAIADLEIDLGLRIAPPDPAKIAQSRELYLQARSYWDTNQRDLFPAALEQLDEAILLNPDNRQAVALKDQMLVATGGQRVDVLSSDDQRLLREAEAKYLSGDYFEALVIIEQLLRKPANKNNQEILDLEKRIRARTG